MFNRRLCNACGLHYAKQLKKKKKAEEQEKNAALTQVPSSFFSIMRFSNTPNMSCSSRGGQQYKDHPKHFKYHCITAISVFVIKFARLLRLCWFSTDQ